MIPQPASGQEAAAGYARALALRLGGDRAGARAALEDVLAADPGHLDAMNSLGVVAWELGDRQAAVDCFVRAVALDPGNAVRLRNLGMVLFESGRLEEAANAYRLAVRLAPEDAQACHSLAVVLRALERWDEAAAMAAQAIGLAPGFATAYETLALILAARRQFDTATKLLREAVRCAPGSFSAWHNLGHLLMAANALDEAVAAFETALAGQPDHPEIRMNLGMARLKCGDFTRGWADYEQRWRTRAFAGHLRPAMLPRWDGSAAPRTLLLSAEQGLGDTLQFCRFAPLVAGRGHHVVLEVDPALVSLLQDSLGSERLAVVARDAGYPGIAGLPPVDAHCPLMSLPLVLGIDADTIPAVPYLRADPVRAAAWAGRLAAAGPGLKVGLVWAGNPRAGGTPTVRDWVARRAIALAGLRPLLDLPGITFVSLQKGEAAAELSAAPSGTIVDAAAELGDFADTAALVAALDLVIGVDTAVCHLAGAMGKPVWLLAQFDCCWRWQRSRADSPWYPATRLFRQTADRSWEPIVDDVRRALGELPEPAHLSGA